jgi:hypothetical protein
LLLYFLSLVIFTEAEATYPSLHAANSENYRYHEALQKCLGLSVEGGKHSPEHVDKLTSLYKSLQEEYLWSAVAKRIPLDFLENEDFRKVEDSYIRPFLTKGVSSLFSDLHLLYDHPGKADILEELILEIEASLQNNGSFSGKSQKEPPLTLLWTLFLLA